MVFAQGLTAIIVFWAVVGGLGAALFLPAMQSLSTGTSRAGREPRCSPCRRGSCGRGGCRTAVGGLLTTLLSWRAGFLLDAVIIAGVLLGTGRIRDVPDTGDRSVDVVGSVVFVLGMQEGASRSLRSWSPRRCSRSRCRPPHTQVMSDAQLDEQIADEPPATREEILGPASRSA